MTKVIYEELKDKLNLTEYETDLLSFLFHNKDKDNLFIVSIPKVSQSGLSRQMKFATQYKDNYINITYIIGRVLGIKMTKNDTLRINGCGMDMVFHTLDNFMASIGVDKTNTLRSVNNYFMI